MFEEKLARVRDIFVGRQAELSRLQGLWGETLEPREHQVYVFLNAPGVGKTTLLRRFGLMLGVRGAALFVHVRAKAEYSSPTALNSDILRVKLSL